MRGMLVNHLKMSARAAVAVAATVVAAGAAQAHTTPLYSGGATLSEKVYRNIFNAYGNTATGDLCVGLAACPTTPYRSNVEVLYLGVGSTNGLKAYDAYSPSLYIASAKKPDNPPVASTRDFGPFFGTGTGASWVPSATATNYFPKTHFSSADGISSTDVAAVTALGFGPPVQVPSLITPIVISFTPTAGWNPKGTLLPGGSSKVNLSTNTLCGIFTGAITDWSAAPIKKDNKGFQLGSGPITVVYRHDGSATTFLLTNALLNQCGTTTHPVSTYPVPDQWLTDNAIANTPPFTSNNSFFINVFNAHHLPANFYNNIAFSTVSGGASSNSGVQLSTDATVGGIGYLSTDFAQPVQTGNDADGRPVDAGANLQTYYTYINNLTPVYEPPTGAHAYYIMSTATPPSFTGGASAPAVNPLNWEPVNPIPTNKNAYPIGGFTYFLLYSCYSSATDVDALVGTTAKSLGLLRWWYGSSAENGGVPLNTMTSEGYSAIPNAWITAAKTLLTTNVYTKISTPGKKSTACAKVSKGA